jgi:hypothetical protein
VTPPSASTTTHKAMAWPQSPVESDDGQVAYC